MTAIDRHASYNALMLVLQVLGGMAAGAFLDDVDVDAELAPSTAAAAAGREGRRELRKAASVTQSRRAAELGSWQYVVDWSIFGMLFGAWLYVQVRISARIASGSPLRSGALEAARSCRSSALLMVCASPGAAVAWLCSARMSVALLMVCASIPVAPRCARCCGYEQVRGASRACTRRQPRPVRSRCFEAGGSRPTMQT